MSYNVKKFFVLANDKGIEAAEIEYSKSYSLNVEIFKGEVSSFKSSNISNVSARGIYKNQMGFASTESVDKNTNEELINDIVNSATSIEKEETPELFKGSKKYHKKNLYHPEVLTKDINIQIETLKRIEKKIKAADPRISEVAILGYEEGEDETILANSYGLKLKDKMATFAYYAEVVATQGEENKSSFKVFESFNLSDFDEDKFVKDVVYDAVKLLGSTQCKSKKYPAILAQNVVKPLLRTLISYADSEQVQKHSSLFDGKLGQEIVSKKLTISETPLYPNTNFTYFDNEGVATYNKDIIKKGVLNTYLYNLETAKKDGVESTGNGNKVSGKVGVGFTTISVKPSKKSEAEIMANIKEGVYICELEGLHAGLDPHSGNFSLQAQGFMIRDGKLAEPLSLITVAGNIVQVFKDVKAVANNIEDKFMSDTLTPSMYIKHLAISGK